MWKNDRIPYFRLIPVLFIAFVLYKLVDDVSILLNGLRLFFSITSYLIWAFVIAFFLNPLMRYLERKFKVKRWCSITIIYTGFLCTLAFVVTIILPGLIRNVTELLENIPYYYNNIEKWVYMVVSEMQLADRFDLLSLVHENKVAVIAEANKILNIGVNVLIDKAINFTSSVIKFIFGLVISIYMLNDKEKFKHGAKRVLYAFLQQETAERFIDIAKEVNSSFSRFIIGRALDSLIIGLICFVGLVIIRAPFSLLISIIVAITNMIPYVGPIIGMVPSVIIVAVIDPVKALWVLVFIILLQQFDGWYLGPQIMGKQVGLRPIFIIIAIIVGGGIFGLVGMFAAVPLMAVAKALFDRHVEKRLKSKNIDI